jgi:MipA family protein
MMRRLPLRFPILLLCLASCSAYAADDTLMTSGRVSEQAATTKQTEVGVGIGVGQSVFGGNVKGARLYGEVSLGNGVFASLQDGLGYRFPIAGSNFSGAISLSDSARRRAPTGDDGPARLRGMGDIDSHEQLNVFLNYDSGPFHAETELSQVLAGRHQTTLSLSGKYDLFASSTDLVQAGAAASYANRNSMQTYFGVTPAQSASSGNAVYAPAGGIEGANLGVTWRHALSKQWVGTLGAGVTVLGNQAADSSLVERRTGLGVGASIGYRF